MFRPQSLCWGLVRYGPFCKLECSLLECWLRLHQIRCYSAIVTLLLSIAMVLINSHFSQNPLAWGSVLLYHDDDPDQRPHGHWNLFNVLTNKKQYKSIKLTKCLVTRVQIHNTIWIRKFCSNHDSLHNCLVGDILYPHWQTIRKSNFL